ncbi:phosphoribosylanthranilate isomerase [Pseudooctadecabacter jejudonensis]|uniref:N-(5'-phosphoribosyl)anthranilate isomerase n=1 Tax=Pseudooctadecabacter jejudonensis TaxID=1391910 RepID=A0A1Y5STK8_9RHOB|nr:phosphoribosylanthranilate isomerase [Pseudooctadecabacter jejudonensis]SLN44777.1 N-(5'-phosphoribosyl)anthranilate isomerase [Pseudooctadecabacter jejudonensis]
MSSHVSVKMCGLRTVADIAAAAAAGAVYVGFVFFPKSPRNVSIAEAAALALEVPVGIMKVALVVNPDDAFLDDLLDHVAIDMIQLHGGESPERVAEVRARFGLPVMKAIGVAGPEDLAKIDVYSAVADQLLIDAKPPKDGELPGGNGLTFDWRLLADRKYWTKPWMLAGGLTPENVGEAVRLTGARQVDLSSALERAPGVKDAAKMADFGAAVARIG